MVGLVLLAAAVRWPDYLYVPVFTDEVREVARSAQIARGQISTLVNDASYIGPLFNYLLAGLFVLLGPRIEVARLLMLVVGSLSVGAAYLLGREWGGRAAGLLAAALLMTNTVHILVNSHVAWSNCLTPLFTTLALWAFSRAVRAGSGGYPLDGSGERGSGDRFSPALFGAAILFGLALLTHPATVLLLPACAVYLVWRAPRLLRSRAVWAAAGVFLVVASPLLIYNLSTGFDSLQKAESSRSDHAVGRALGADLYLSNAAGFALLLLRTLAGAIDPQLGPLEHLRDPVVLLWLGLAVAAVIGLARRGNPLPLLLMVSSLVLAPFWSVNRFEPVTNGRYLMPTAVALVAAVAAAAVGLIPAAGRGVRLRSLALGLLTVGAVVLVIQPLVELVRFYDSRPPDNRSTLEALARIEGGRQPGEVVIVDGHLNARRLAEIGFTIDNVAEMLLTIRGIPFEEVDVGPEAIQTRLVGRRSLIAVLDGSSVEPLQSRFSLTPLAEISPRMNRNERQRDAVVSWRDLPISALLRRLDRQRAAEQRSTRLCTDCPDPAVYRIAPRS